MAPPGQPRTSQGLRTCGRRCGVIVADCCGSGSGREILNELCDLLLDVLGLGSFIRSHASAGHLVVYFVTGQMVGDRRSPGATILGVESIYLLSQPSLFQSRRQFQYIVMRPSSCAW